VENAGPENGGPENGGPEIAGPSTCVENAGIMSVYPYEIYHKLNAPFTPIFNYHGVILI